MMPIFSASAIGFMANMVLPFRVGEVARPWLVARERRPAPPRTFATVVVERVLDLLALAMFGLGIVLARATCRPTITCGRPRSRPALCLCHCSSALWVVVRTARSVLPILDQLWQRIPDGRPGAAARSSTSSSTGWRRSPNPPLLVRAVAWSFYIWFLDRDLVCARLPSAIGHRRAVHRAAASP